MNSFPRDGCQIPAQCLGTVSHQQRWPVVLRRHAGPPRVSFVPATVATARVPHLIYNPARDNLHASTFHPGSLRVTRHAPRSAPASVGAGLQHHADGGGQRTKATVINRLTAVFVPRTSRQGLKSSVTSQSRGCGEVCAAWRCSGGRMEMNLVPSREIHA
jgi:hypothetical protein